MTDTETPIEPAPYSADELGTIRDALPGTTERVYLNAGFMGPMPTQAVSTMRARIDVAEHALGLVDLGDDATAAGEQGATGFGQLYPLADAVEQAGIQREL